MRIAMVSEHASPLAVLGGVDAGGQNVHVAALSDELARRGHAVSVFTRRDDPEFSDRVRLPSGVEVVHVAAGPAEPLPKDDLLPHMFRFARVLRNAWEEEPPDVVHAHFWMSGVASLEAASALSLPVVETPTAGPLSPSFSPSWRRADRRARRARIARPTLRRSRPR